MPQTALHVFESCLNTVILKEGLCVPLGVQIEQNGDFNS